MFDLLSEQHQIHALAAQLIDKAEGQLQIPKPIARSRTKVPTKRAAAAKK